MSERRYVMGVCPGARETSWTTLLQDADTDFETLIPRIRGYQCFEFFGFGVVKSGDSLERAGYVNRVNAKIAEEINFSEGIGREFRLGIERGETPISFRCAEVCAGISEVCLRFGSACRLPYTGEFKHSEFRFENPGPLPEGLGQMGYVLFGKTRVWAEPELQADLARLWRPAAFSVLAGQSDPDEAVSRALIP